MDNAPKLILGNSPIDWLIALGIAVALSAVLIFFKRLIARHFLRLAKKTETDLDDMIAGLIDRFSPVLFILIGMYAGSFWLNLTASAHDIVNHVLFAAGIIQAALFGNSIIVYLITKTTRLREYDDASAKTSLNVLAFLSKLVLWSVVVLVILDNLGFDITTLIASLGIGGIAVALAAQSILAELFASLSIAIDKPFVIGDFIVIDNFLGTIEKIGMRTTHIRSLGGELIIFSNTDLLKSRIRNYKRMEERRIVFALGVVYGTPAEQVESITGYVRDIVEADALTRFDRGHFKEYGTFSLNFEFVYYVLSREYNDYMDTQQRINLAIYRKFMDEGLEFAFPTQTVHVQEAARQIPSSSRENRNARD